MISRVAESCYWLHRYVERAESTARLVAVNRLSILDAGIHDAQRWKPIVVTVGEDQRFEQLVGAKGYDHDVEAEDFLTWSDDNPSSIRSSLRAARENARMTREVISREMWETINTFWQSMNSPSAVREYRKDRASFYQRVLSVCAEFQGNCHNTMLHDEPFDFMRMGMLLERASQTIRVLDVKHVWLAGGRSGNGESPQESAQWMAILRLCVAIEPFFKRYLAAPTGPLVTRFLLQDAAFPRSVVHCLEGMRRFLERIKKDTQRRTLPSLSALERTSKQLRAANIATITPSELHGLLEELLESIDGLNHQLYADFFEPASILQRTS